MRGKAIPPPSRIRCSSAYAALRHRGRAAGRTVSGLKRSSHKSNRAEVQHSTHGDDNKDGESKFKQSFA
jgi:hypothetical protein